MMKIFLMLMMAAGLLFVQTASAGSAVDALLDEYRAAGVGVFSADAGQRMWTKTQSSNKAPLERRCSSCHSNDLSNAGKHVKTKKVIKAMAPGVNTKRLTDIKKIRKWFKRNCKWTLGRECTPQEKGDFLLYIQK